MKTTAPRSKVNAPTAREVRAAVAAASAAAEGARTHAAELAALAWTGLAANARATSAAEYVYGHEDVPAVEEAAGGIDDVLRELAEAAEFAKHAKGALRLLATRPRDDGEAVEENEL